MKRQDGVVPNAEDPFVHIEDAAILAGRRERYVVSPPGTTNFGEAP
jgi:hypothetical protein